MSHRIFHPNARKSPGCPGEGLSSCISRRGTRHQSMTIPLTEHVLAVSFKQICPFHKGFCPTHYAFGGMLPASHMASCLPKIGQLVCPQTFGPLIQNSRLAKHRSSGGGDSINSCIYILSCIIHAKKTRKRQNHGMDIWVCPNIRA